MLSEHVGRALDEPCALGHDRHGPAVAQQRSDVFDGAVGLAREARHRGGGKAEVVVDARDQFGIREVVLGGAGVERAEGPPRAVARRFAQRRERHEVAGVEVDRRLRSGGGGVPRRVEELAVGLDEVDGSAGDALRGEDGDRGIHRQVVGERHEPVDERGGERLHALDRDALGDLREHAREARELVLHLARPLPHGRGEQQLAARRQLDTRDGLWQRALVGDRELAELLELVAEELEPQRVLGDRREHVEDAAAHRELAAPRDHVDAGVGEVDELRGELGEVVPATACRELDRLDVGEVVGERLQRRAHRRDEHEGMRLRPRTPLREVTQRRDPAPDRLGARAEALVRQGLPRGEVDDLGVRSVGLEGAAERLALAAGRGDDEHGTWSCEQPGDQGCPQAVDEGEVRAP